MNDPVRIFLSNIGCAEHVVEGGLAGLVSSWEKVVADVDEGYPLGLDDYLNELDIRKLLAEALTVAPRVEKINALERVQRADEKMQSLTTPVENCLWGDEVAEEEGWSAEKQWWYYRVPKNAGPELMAELAENI